MNTRQGLLAFLCALAPALAIPEPWRVETERFSATFSEQGLVALEDASGTHMVGPGELREGVGIHRVEGSHWASAMHALRYTGFEELEGASVDCTLNVDDAAGDLAITQRAKAPEPGVWGVQWTIGRIPLEMNVIVPGRSGIKLTHRSPGSGHEFDYPVGWEAQFVIIEGEGRGFWVWADDVEGRYKRLRVSRGPEGWEIALISMNYAPFDGHTACESVVWRLNTYEGDWRVPARRYRAWAEAHLRPTRIEEQTPAWVKNIRCVIITGVDEALVTALTKRIEPAGTLLYIPSWRAAGYDRDYPSYDEPVEGLRNFIAHAHGLGYRVMLHVNYFGCDPLNPLYEHFEPYQLRSPWGDHEKQWWLWERATPVIRFAYINPAHKPWRELFIARMQTLCMDYAVDALHLDQTLCIS
ncbi:MAG TPA: hypothetical protein ENN80_02290, partial [Candidatus Hydrogenedentes bacterium]|nr:hypothetical protein [Candidatus Hydrogenedentota bacterium]